MEEHLYEQVVLEIHRGEKRDGLWAKALTNSGGSEVKARSLYIKYRVQSIKDEAEIYNAFAEEAKESAAIEYQRRIALCIKALDTNGYQFIETKTEQGWLVIKPSGGCELIETIEDLERRAGI